MMNFAVQITILAIEIKRC